MARTRRRSGRTRRSYRTRRSAPGRRSGPRRRAGSLSRSRGLLLLAAAGLAVLVACTALQSGGVGGPPGGGPSGPAGPAAGGPAVPVRSADAAIARTELGRLSVADPQPAGYQRTRDFGSAWSYDFDHNGCRERDDVLRRDLTGVQLRNRCTVVSGVLADPYTGRTIRFTKQDAGKVQIDHVFPLAAAWGHGARSWSSARRLQFANDPGNLLATSGTANESKGDGTPAEWQPRPGFRCAYAVRYVTVASRYRLTVSAADRSALSRMLGSCPGRP